MNINHENNHLIFPEMIACMALSATPPLMLDLTFAENQIMAAPPLTVRQSFLYVIHMLLLFY